MADAAVAGASNCGFFASSAVEGFENRVTALICLRVLPSSSKPHSFQESVSKRQSTMSSLKYSRPLQSSLQINAAVGYPPSMTWWKKGNQPNMREIHSTEEFLDALSKTGDRLVLVDFFSVGCRSCKAIHPKVCQIAAENPDVEVLKVDFHDNSSLCRSLNINILPFFQLYRGADGRLDAFSCSLAKVNKLRDAVAKHKSACPIKYNPLVVKENNSSLSPLVKQ